LLRSSSSFCAVAGRTVIDNPMSPLTHSGPASAGSPLGVAVQEECTSRIVGRTRA
jgi:hypothetical protein